MKNRFKGPSPVCPAAGVARRLALAALLLASPLGRAEAVAEEPPQLVLEEHLRQTVMPAVELPSGTGRVEFEVGRLDPRLQLAPCSRIETQLPQRGNLWGKIRVAVRCVEGEKPWRVYVPVTVHVYAPALVPVRALAAGTVLAPDHLRLAEVDWAASGTPPLVEAQAALGRTLARPLLPGQPLLQNDLRQRQWFAAGDTVQLVARGAGFVVSGEGQALSAGLEGQTVRVRTESGRILTGRPVSARRVEVML